MDTEKLERLFREYERAFDQLDFTTIAKKYPDNFLSAGPKGSMAQNKQKFEDWAKQASEMYRSIGQNAARIISKKIISISNEYCMVTVHWGVTYEKTGDKPVEFDVSYIVQDIDGI